MLPICNKNCYSNIADLGISLGKGLDTFATLG